MRILIITLYLSVYRGIQTEISVSWTKLLFCYQKVLQTFTESAKAYIFLCTFHLYELGSTVDSTDDLYQFLLVYKTEYTHFSHLSELHIALQMQLPVHQHYLVSSTGKFIFTDSNCTIHNKNHSYQYFATHRR